MTEKERMEWFEELYKILPSLNIYKKHAQYELPANYFEDVEEEIMAQISIDLSGNHNLGIPEGYFEKVEEEIIDTLNKSNYLSNFTYLLKEKIAMAASFSVLIVAVFCLYYFTKENVASSQEFVSEMTDEESVEFLMIYTDEHDIYTFIEDGLIEEQELNITNIND